jgi:glycosyltransferase involved in cell wall biosynthesis
MNCSKDDSGTCCGMCYNVSVVIATHERKEITTRNIESLKLQTPKPRIIIVCSLHEEFEYYKTLGVTVILEPNRPLGRKWQCGVNVAKNMNSDVLIILGSDDILHKDYIKNAIGLIHKGYEFVGTTHWYMEDKNSQLFHCQYINQNKDFPIGSGKVYTKALLDRFNWKVFDVKADRKLDDQGHRMLGNAKIHLIREPMILAVKAEIYFVKG